MRFLKESVNITLSEEDLVTLMHSRIDAWSDDQFDKATKEIYKEYVEQAVYDGIFDGMNYSDGIDVYIDNLMVNESSVVTRGDVEYDEIVDVYEDNPYEEKLLYVKQLPNDEFVFLVSER